MSEHFEISSRNHSTFDDLMEGFQVIGFDWRYLYVNDSVVRQAKCTSKDDLLGYTMMEKFPGIENTELFKVLKQCMNERISKNMENEFTFPDNTKGWFELRIQPVPDGIFVLSMDITARKITEQERQKHIRGLEEMLFMTSHKIRQPVAHILGISNLLSVSNHQQNDLNKIAGYMKQSASSLDTFTRELVTFIHEQKIKTLL